MPANAATLRLTGSSDTTFNPGAVDDTRTIGETVALDLWIDASDTDVNGLEATIVFDGTQLQLLDSSLVTDSFPPDSPGIQSREDRAVFGDVLFNYGLATGTASDTARYAALTLADSTRATARAVRFTFLIKPTASAGLTYVTFRSTAEETTAITHADTGARNVLTATDTGVILIQGVTDTHLVLTLVAPNAPEHFAIYNPTGAAVDLSNYYVSDDDSNYVRAVNAPAVSSGDWIVRFPAGTILAAGDTLTVAISSDDLHGVMPGMPVDFEINQDGAGDGVADMTLVATSGTRGLTNAGEPVILFYWDGASDLVKDVDILVYGTGTVPNKTGKSLDGPDGDAIATTYLGDLATMTRPSAPATAQVLRRSSFLGGDSGTGESTSGGNGITSHDETTESAATSWAATTDSQPWHTALVAYKIGEVPTSIAEAGETGVEALYVRIRGARGRADTVTQIDIRTLGTADTANIDTVSIWIDAGGDSVIGAADTFVGNLAATGTSTWRFTGSIAVPAVTGYREGVSLIFGFAAGATVQNGETVQFQLDTYGIQASLSESGSFRALVNANAVTLVAGVLRVTKLAEAAAVTFKPGDTGVTVAAVRVTGVATDSLTNLAVANLGLLNDLDVSVQIWRDSDQSFTYSYGDVLVGTFGWSTDRLRWELTGLSETLAVGGDTFVVTISAFDTALLEGDTFQATFPAFASDAVTAETGPALAVSNANAQTLISPPGTASRVVIAAFYADESGADDNGEWILLYNPTDTPTSVQNWTVRRTAALLATLPDSTIPARGWYLVAANQYDTAKDQAAWPTADFRPSSFTSLNNTNNGLQLADSTGVILDRVGYGTEATMKEGTTVSNPTSQQVYVRKPHALSDNGSVLSGGRDEQGGAGFDTYDNATDFVALAQADLGAWILRNSTSPSETPALKITSVRLQDTPANATVRQNESGVTAAVVFLKGDTSAAGTLESFRVEATDPVEDTNFAAIRLYRDNNADRRWDAADSLVAALAPTGTAAWESTVIGWSFDALNGETFLVVVAASETVTTGETLQIRIAARTVKASGAESGPTTARLSGTVLTLTQTTPLAVTLNASIGSETVTPTADSRTVIAFRVRGNPSGDTLTRFPVANSGIMDTGDITQVQLFADADRDSRYSTGDTFITTLTATSSRQWEASGLSVYLGAALDFVVTIDLGTAGNLDSFRAYIPAQGVNVTLYDTGPSDSVSENGRVTVSTAQAVRMILTEVDVQTGTDFVELWVLDDGNGGAGANIAGWTITEYALGSADRKVFGDTDNNGTVDTIVWARTGDRIVAWDAAGTDSDIAVAGMLDLFNSGLALTATNDEVLLYDPVNTLRDAVAWSNRDRAHTDAADLAAVIAAGAWQGFATENAAVTPRTGTSFVSGYSIQRGGLTDRDTYLDWGEAPRTPGAANAVDSPPVPMARITGIQLVDNPNDLGGSLRLTWTPDTTNPNFLEYRIYLETYPLRSILETNAVPNTTVTDSRTGSATISSLVNGDSYYAVVTAVDTFGLEYRFGLSDTGPAAPRNNITGMPRILVNEVFAQATGGTDTDYIELYVADDGNPAGNLDLTGWRLTWHSGGTKTLGATTVATGDYILLTFNSTATDDSDSSGDGVANVWHSSTGLAAAAGYVRVATPSDSVVDFLFYAERTAALAAALQTAVRSAVDSGAWRGDSTVNSAVNGRAVDGGFLSNDIFARDGASSDTTHSRDEWNVQTVRTPGAVNAGGEHPIVLNDTRTVRIFQDLANDFGGVLVIGWDTDVTQSDFLRYNIYLETAPIGPRIDTGALRPDSTVRDSAVGLTTITGLRDGDSYYVLVTVTDSWGHERRIGLLETGPVAPLRNVGGEPVIKITEVKFAGTDTSEFIELRVLSDGNATGQLNLAGFKVAVDDTVAGDILTFGNITVTDSDYIVLRNEAGTSEVDSGHDGVVNIYGVSLGLAATDEGVFVLTSADTILDFVYWSDRDGTTSAAEVTDLAYAVARGAWTNSGQNAGRNPVVRTTFLTATSITRDALHTDNNGDTDWAVDSPPTPGGVPNIAEAPFAAPAAVAGLVAADVANDFGGSIRLTWTPAGVSDLYLYNIYRETTALPASLYGTSLFPRDTAGPADSSFVLNGLTNGETWWFAVIAVDSYGNERKFGYAVESAAARIDLTIDTLLPNTWYLNDTSTTGDSFTGVPGSDAANGLTPWTPKRTWAALRPFLTVGDSVYIDSGVYNETVVVDTDFLTILGVDSASTILDGSNNAAAHDTGIAVVGRNGFRAENLQVRAGSEGVVLLGADTAVFYRVRVTGVSSNGIRIEQGSDSAILEAIRVDGAGVWGVMVQGSDSATIRNGVFTNALWFDSAADGVQFLGNGIYNTGGISFEESSYHHVIAGNVSQNVEWSILVRQSTIANNTSLGHNAGAVVFTLGGESNTFTGNSATASFFRAFDLGGAGQTVANCSALLGSNIGFSLFAFRSGTFTGNIAYGNSSYGVSIEGSESSVVSGNRIESNTLSGLRIAASTGLRVSQNLISTNRDQGVLLDGDTGNVVVQNRIESNTNYQVWLQNGSNGTMLAKNIILPSAARPDSRVRNLSSSGEVLSRNWWGSIDTLAFARGVVGSPVVHTPFRLGVVDTAAGADTVAPRAPDTVSAVGVTESAIVVTWSAVTASEEPEGALNLTGYRVWRSRTADTSVWVPLISVGAGTVSYTDSGFQPAETWYYRVTSFDGAGVENQSFYSDSIARGTTPNESTPPSAFTLLVPTAGYDTTATRIGFTWSTSTDSSGPVRYRLIVDTDMAGSFLVDTTILETSVVVPVLPVNDTYTWRVTALDSWGNATTAGDSRFTIDTVPPTAPALVGPADALETSSTTLLFSWLVSFDTLSGLAGYRIQVDTSLSFASPIVDSFTTALSGWRTLTPNDTYWWRVLSVDDAGNTASDTPRRFRIDTVPPSAPAAVYPVALSETNAPSVGFLWMASADTLSGLFGYRFQVDTTGLFSGPLAVDSPQATSETALALSEGLWYWRVRAVDSAGNASAYTDSIAFRVDRTPPVILAVLPLSSVVGHFTDSGGIDTAAFLDTVWFNNGGVGASQAVTVTVLASGADTVSYPQAFGEGPLEDSTIPFAFVYTVELGHGDTQTLLVARDTAGNIDTVLVHWIRDTVPPPVVTLTNPGALQVIGDTTPTFSWLASSDTGVGTVRYMVQVAADTAFTVVVESSFVAATSYTSSGLADSIWYWRVLGYDSVSNADTGAATVQSFRIDSGVPVIAAIAIVSSAPSFFFDDTPVTPGLVPDTVYYNPTGAGAGQVCTITVWVTDINETAVELFTSYTVLRAIDSGLNRDSYEVILQVPLDSASSAVRLRAADATGFQDTSFVWFEMDTTGPSAPVGQSPADGYDTAALTIAFSWSASTDTRAGLAGYRLQIDTSSSFAAPLVDSSTGAAQSATRTLNPNDTYWWRVIAVDRVGCTTAGPARILRVDTVAPTVSTLSGPVDRLDTASTTLLFSWLVSFDSVSGLARYRLQVDTSSTFASPIVDSALPTSSLSAWRTLAIDDTYWWRIVAVDSAGNTSVDTARSFRIDSTVPTAPALHTLNGESYTTVPTLRWTASTDTLTGIAAYIVQIDSSSTFASPRESVTLAWNDTDHIPTTLAIDTYYWRVYAVDSAGNRRVSSPLFDSYRLYNPDTLPPSAFTLTLPPDLHETRASSLTLRWANSLDETSPPVQYRIQLDTAGTFAAPYYDTTGYLETFAVITAFRANETTTWRVIASDNSGNTTVVTTAWRVIVDTTPPAVFTLTAPGTPHDTTNTLITFTWSASADTVSGLFGYRLQIDTAGTFASLLVDSATPLTTGSRTLGANDTYYWRVVAVDDAGNTVAVGPSILRVDTAGPNPATLVSPADGFDTSSTTLVFTWSAGSDTVSGLASYRLQIDSSSTFASPLVDSLAGLALSGTRTLVPNDTYWWRVIAVDASGNTTASSARLIRVDTVAPTVSTLSGPVDRLDTASTTLLFSWLVSFDSVSGVARYRLQVDTSSTFATPIVDSAVPTSSLSAWRTLAFDDTYWWRIVAVDSAGNTSTDTARSFRIDSTVPTAPALHALNGESYTTVPTLRWTASTDTLTGIAAYIVQIDSASTFASPRESVTLAWNDTDHVPTTLAIDTYYWRVYAVDSAGNRRLSSPAFDSYRLFIQDTTPPSAFTLTLPPDLHETRATTLTLRWANSLDETSPPVRYRIQLDTAGTFAAPYYDTAGYLETFAVITAFRVSETTTWRVIASDNAGNTTVVTTAWRVVVDTTPPAVFTLTAPATPQDTTNTSVTFTWASSSDTVSGLFGYRLQLDTAGTFVSLLVDSATPLTTGVRTLGANDTYYWRVVAVDDAGNTVAVGPNVLRIDTGAPNPAALTSPADGFDTSSTALAFTWTAGSDTVSGIASYRLQIDSAATFASPLVDSLAGLALSGTRTLSPNDTYWWRVIAVDASGNTTASSARVFRVDTVPPSKPTPTGPVDELDTSSATIQFSWFVAFDTLSGLARYRLQVDTSSTFASPLVDSAVRTAQLSAWRTLSVNDTYWWRIVAEDTAGNTAADTARILVIDSAVPTAPALHVLNGESSATPPTLRWTASTDTLSGIMSYIVQVDTSSTFSSPRESATLAWNDTDYVSTLTVLDTYYWRVYAVDSAGNLRLSAPAFDSYRVYVLDTTAPTSFALTSPPDLHETVTQTMTFRWGTSQDSSSPPVRYRIQLDTAGTFAAPYYDTTGYLETFAVITAFRVNETTTWRVIASDNAGNTTVVTTAWRIIVDTTPPAVFTLTAPATPHDTTNTSVTFTWASSSDTVSGLFGYRLQLDTAGTFVSLLVDSATPLTTGSRTLAANDTYYWRVVAVDDAGNTVAVGPNVIRIDTGAPNPAALTSPADGFDTSSTTLVFAWTAGSDTVSGVASYRLQIDSSSTFAAPLVDSLAGLALSGTRTLVPNDTYWWRVIAVDASGNTTASSARLFRVDTVPPSKPTPTGPVDGLDTSSATIQFSWFVAFDTLSGLARYRLQVDTSSSFASPLVDSAVRTSQLSAWRTLTVNDTYWWRIVAEDSAGNTAADTARILVIDSAVPTAPALHVLNGETSATPPTLRWTASTDTLSGIMSYIVQVDTSSTFASPRESVTLAWNDTDYVSTLTPFDTYYWRVYAVDSAGNLRLSTPAFDSYRVYILDTTAPTAFALALPPDLHETTAAALTLRWETSQDSSSPPVRYRIQLDTAGTFAAPYYDTTGYLETFAVITAFRVNETTTWRVIASDNAGNTTVVTTAWRIIVDTTPPAVFTLTAPATPHDTTNTVVTFTWSASADTVSGLFGYRLQLDTAGTFASLLVDSATPLTTGSRTLAANDTYYWRVVAVDDAGNTVAVGPSLLRIDTVFPAAGQPVTPENGLETRATMFVFSWTAGSDSTSGVAYYRLQADTSGAFTAVLADTTTTALTLTITNFVLQDTFYWRVTTVDSAGNSAVSGTFLFRRDSQPPAAGALASPADLLDTSSATILFTWTASSDTGTGVDTYRIQVDTTSAFTSPFVDSVTGTSLTAWRTLPVNDTYYWRVVAVDGAGNVVAYSARRLRVDTAPPTVAVLTRVNGETRVPILTLAWTASTDSVTGVAAYVLQVDTAGTFATLRESVTLAWNDTDHQSAMTAQDTYWWRVLAYDSAGNVSTSLVDSFYLVRLDTVPPSAFALSSPADLHETRATSFTLRWGTSIDDSSPPVRYRVQLDTAGTFTAPYYDTTGYLETYALIAAFRANETTTWRVIAADNAGNTTVVAASRRIVVDTATPAAFTLTAPATGTDTRSTSITFTWAASSDTIAGLSGYRLQVDTAGTFVAPFIDSSTPLTSGTRTLPANETYSWRIVAVDDAGNTIAAAPHVLRIDTAGPVAGVLLAPANGHNTTAVTIAFTWTAATDTISGLAGYRLQVDTAATFLVPLVDSATGLATTGTLVSLRANDTLYWRVVAVDVAGNTTAYAAFALLVDTAGPTAATSTAPAALHDTTATTITFAWSASTDTGSGVSGYRLQVDTSGTFTALLVDSATGSVLSGSRTLPANDTYWWRVVAVDNMGNTTANTPRRLRIDTAPPSRPVLAAFASDSTLAPLTLRWSLAADSIVGVIRFVVQVDTVTAFSAPTESAALAATETSYLTSDLRPDTWFWRVAAYDTLGNVVVSLVDTFVVRSSDTTPPSAFALVSPSDRAFTSSTALTFTWGVSTDDTSPPVTYRLQVDTSGTFLALVAETSGLSGTSTALTLAANDTYWWRVIARDNVGNTTVATSAFRVSVDTRPPSTPVLSARSGASVNTPLYLSWGAVTDSISGVARFLLQVDSEPTFASPIADSLYQSPLDTDYWTGALAVDTYYWRVLAYDTAGNVAASATDSFRVAVPDSVGPVFLGASATPSSVNNAGTTSVTFTILVTDSTYVTSVLVRLAPVGGSDSSFATPSTAVPSADSRWTLTFTVDSTVTGETYDLVVYAFDPNMNSSTTTVRLVVVDTSAPLTILVDSSIYQARVSGNAISVISTYGDSYTKVVYQYRALPTGSWQNCTPATGSTNPDTVAPFWGFFWDVSMLPAGGYDIRAIGTDLAGVTDPNPSSLRMYINPVDSNVHEYRDPVTGHHIRRQRFAPDTAGYSAIADGTALEVPTGAMTDSGWIRITVLDTNTSSSPLPSFLVSVAGGTFRELTREDGVRLFGKDIRITLPYADTDPLDDYVGQTTTREADLAMYYYDTAISAWVKIPTSTVDPVRNVVRATVSHFTLFAVLAGAPAATSLVDYVLYPNPFVPYDGNDRNGKPYDGSDPSSGVIFDSLPLQVTVEVFDITGRKVAQMAKNSNDARYRWDARGDDGRELASGVYIVIVRSSSTGERVIKKLMIIR